MSPSGEMQSRAVGVNDAATIEPPGLPAISRSDVLLAAEFAKGWPQILLGVAIAGGAYPLVGATIFTCILIYMALVAGTTFNASDFIESIGMIIFNTCFASLIGFAWAAVACACTFPFVYLFLRSLEMRGSIVRLGASCGGLVGFAAILPLLIMMVVNEHIEFWQFVFTIALGPCLTTVLGQLGGAWGGRRAEHKSEAWYQKQLAASTVRDNGGPVQDSILASTTGITKRRFQFQIRHLLWLALWASLLLTLIRLSGVPFDVMLVVLIGWLLFQAATLWVGGRLLRSAAASRSSADERQIRST
jgi:hypothetical protein